MSSPKARVVFILGAGRSGSTLLELILDSHSGIRGLGELNHLPPIVNKSSRGAERFCSLCGSDCDLWNRTYDVSLIRRYFSSGGILAGPRRSLLRRLKSIYAWFAEWSPEPILVDSSKHIRWIRRALTPAYAWRNLEPSILYLTRDGRAVASARLRTHSDLTIEQAAQAWVARTRQNNAFLARFPPARAHQLAYEDLAANPDASVRDVVRFLGVDFEPPMLRYWEHPHHVVGGNQWLINSYVRHREADGEGTGEGGRRIWEGAGSANWHAAGGPGIRLDERWRSELDEGQLAAFERIAGKVNRSLGYGA